MTITINGQHKELENGLTVQKILEKEGYTNKIVAVAVNGQFVPKENYMTTAINDNDDIEILAPMQGG